MSSRWLPSGTPRLLLWTGILTCAALFLFLFATSTQVIPGQVQDLPAAFFLVVALLVGIVLRDTKVCRRLLEIVARPRSFALLSLVVFVVLAVGSLLVFRTRPTTSDELAHLYQAQLFAQFKVVATYPPGLVDRIIPTGYQNNFILVSLDGRAMSVYWPAWALLMTPFVWLGAPWLLGPAMASLGTYVLGRLTSLLAGAQAAAVAILLAVTSGSFLVTGMSLQTAGGYLTLNMLYAWLLLRGARGDVLLAGFVGGLALNMNNPVPHALFALPWVIWLAVDITRRRRLVWLVIGYAPWLAVSVAWLLVASSLNASAPGTTGNFWQGRLPSLLSVPTLQVVGLRFWELVRLWIWSAPGLLVLAALGWRRATRNSGAWLLGAAFGLTVVLYVFFPASQGHAYGARYYQSAWGALPILAAILLTRPDADSLQRVVLTAALAGVVLVLPFQVAYALDSGRSLGAGDASLDSLAASGGDLCFIRYTDSENPTLPLLDDLSLHGRVVLISFGQTADQALVDQWFPGAQVLTRTSSGSCYVRR